MPVAAPGRYEAGPDDLQLVCSWLDVGAAGTWFVARLWMDRGDPAPGTHSTLRRPPSRTDTTEPLHRLGK